MSIIFTSKCPLWPCQDLKICNKVFLFDLEKLKKKQKGTHLTKRSERKNKVLPNSRPHRLGNTKMKKPIK